jgi:hypothetical protein
MTLRDYTANVISASKVVPDGAFQDSAASGVWDINEALDLIKGGNWPTTGNFNPAAFVDGLFSTHVYDGTGSAQTITNNIDLSNKGGLVWIKQRSQDRDHALFDTERGVGKYIRTNQQTEESTQSLAVSAFNSNGFSLGGSNGITNNSSQEYVSWTFREQPKFFDVVTYTGDGNAGRTVSHSLGTTVGMLIIKSTSNSSDWSVFHRSVGNDKYLAINENHSAQTDTTRFHSTTPSSTTFTLGSGNAVNGSGRTYVAYLFAHNNNDGGFGEPGDQDIIKCGSYTGNGSSTGPEINLGFEPQLIIIKRTNNAANWTIIDTIRGITQDGDHPYLQPNVNSQEYDGAYIRTLPTGFQPRTTSSQFNNSSSTYIYMAIRRGGMQTPTAASSVFNVSTGVGSDPGYVSGFTVDMAFERNYGSTANTEIASRLTGKKVLKINSTDAESTSNNTTFDYMNGFFAGTKGSSEIAWMWKRARGYFDVVAYTGNSVAGRTINHNLGVAPEMMWVKRRSDANNWTMYHKGIDATAPEDYGIYLDDTAQRVDSVNFWNDTAPTSSVFTVGAASKTNADTATYIAYLFATVAGVSKVGSYTANGSAQNIDCGFTNGAKFVLIRRSSGTGNLFVIDTTRGLVAGNDPLLELNSTSAEDSGYDNIDPHSSGFTITAYGGTSPYLNISGATYIFYAIA